MTINSLLKSSCAALALLASGCTDLGAVRDFAHLSAETASYNTLVATYVGYPGRSGRYGQNLPDVTARRQQQAPRLLGLQKAVTGYMDALGTIAADEAVTVKPGPLVDAASKIAGFDAGTANAIKAVADVITQAILGAWREHEVVLMIERGNPPLQDVLTRLETFAKVTGDEDREELLQMAQYYDGLRLRSRDQAGIAAAAEWREYHEADVAARGPGRDNYLKALARIRSGHQYLFDHRNDLSVKETVRQIKLIDADLQVIAKLLKI